MDTGDKIIREMEIFGNAATAVYSMYNTGGGDFQPHSDLPTKLYDGPVPIAGVVTAENAESNDNMRRCLVNELAGKMLISVWEILRYTDYNDYDKYPEVAFLRHVRNGIAHDNEFDLSESILDSKGPAEWNGYKLDPSLDDETVMTTIKDSRDFIGESDIEEGYLEAGDCKELCSDLVRITKE